MKKIDYSNIALGMETSPSFSEALQLGSLSRFEAICKGLLGVDADVVILYGCVIDVSGQTYTMTAGAVYYNGNIYTVDAFGGDAPGGQVGIWTVADAFYKQAWYGDDTKKDTFLENKMTLTFGAAGSGIKDHDAAVLFDAKLNTTLDTQGKIDTAVAALVASSPAALDTLNELAAALGDDPNFATTVTNLISTAQAAADAAQTDADTAQTTANTGVTNAATAQAAAVAAQADATTAIGDAADAQATADLKLDKSKFDLAVGTPNLRMKVIEIGDWDMDTDTNANVAHGIADHKKIRSISAIVRNDSDSSYHDLSQPLSDGTVGGGIGSFNSVNIILSRTNTLPFATTDFNTSSAYNRGWVTITYEA